MREDERQGEMTIERQTIEKEGVATIREEVRD
jgi:hypothetical protein